MLFFRLFRLLLTLADYRMTLFGLWMIPSLAVLIICLSLRLRLSRPRISEFLQDWLGISLSVGCINQCLTEGGRAVAPVKDKLVAEIQQSELLHADETGWEESGRTVWLWVLRSATVTLYIIGRRSWEVIANIMEPFGGWLMSDGYGQYRHYGKRLRCLAHLIVRLSSCRSPQGTRVGRELPPGSGGVWANCSANNGPGNRGHLFGARRPDARPDGKIHGGIGAVAGSM